MIYLVISWRVGPPGRSDYTKIQAAFKSRHLAEIYCLHKQKNLGTEYNKFFVQEVSILDGTPEMNKIVLEGSRN